MIGHFRIVNKRRTVGPKPEPDETVMDGDRQHPVLGNRHELLDKDDIAERRRVIDLYRQDLEADWAKHGPMRKVMEQLALRVAGGEKIACGCWCAPRPCHLDLVQARVMEMATVVSKATEPPLPDPMYRLVPHPEDDSPDSLIQRTTDNTFFCAEPLPNQWAEVIVEFCNSAYGEGRHDAEQDIWKHADAIAHAEAAGQCAMPQATVYTVGRWRGTDWGMSHGPFHVEQAALEVSGDEGDRILRIGMDGKTTVLWEWNSTKLQWQKDTKPADLRP